ncbi:ATP-binding cassette transporter snq2 [Balamuthia mandrillaris]
MSSSSSSESRRPSSASASSSSSEDESEHNNSTSNAVTSLPPEKLKEKSEDQTQGDGSSSSSEEEDDTSSEPEALTKKTKEERSADDDDDDEEADGTSEEETDDYELSESEEADWPEADLGTEPSFTMMGAYRSTLPDYIRELRRAMQESGQLNPVAFSTTFVSVEDLFYSVKLAIPAKPTIDENKNAFLQALKARFNFRAKHQKTKVNVLKDITFYLKPGQMTLVLGSPNCGKDVLFKILANQVHQGKVRGTMLFNGERPDNSRYHKLISYITQEDLHLPMLTVKETIEFSHRCRMADAALRPERVDILLQLLNLAHRADTIVGDQNIRGVSGGEKKRVTIGAEVIKLSQIILLDECTTGLDATAALSVLRVVRALADAGRTVLCALRQPSYEILSLFDNLIIMTAGEIAYFGPLKKSLGYFRALGYECPPNINPAVFLQEVVEYCENFISPSVPSNFAPHTPADFVAEWKKSELAQKSLDIIREKGIKRKLKSQKFREENNQSTNDIAAEDEEKQQEKESLKSNIELKDYKKEQMYPISTAEQFNLVQKREFTIVFRDKATLLTRLLRSLVLSLILASLYFQLSNTQVDARNRQGLIFFSLTYVAFSAFSTLPRTSLGRAVFYRQSDAKYHGTLSYALSIVIADMPVILMDVVLFSTIVYWMCGLNSEQGERYLFFLLIMFTTAVVMACFIRVVAVSCPNDIVANTVSPVFIVLILLFCGYLIPPGSIPPWFIWLYWIDPLRYAFEAIMINEFEALPLRCASDELVPPQPLADDQYGGTQLCPTTNGDQILDRLELSTNLDYRWVWFAVLWAWFLLYVFLTYLTLRYLRFRDEPPIIPAELRKTLLGNSSATGANGKGARKSVEMSNLSGFYKTIRASGEKGEDGDENKRGSLIRRSRKKKKKARKNPPSISDVDGERVSDAVVQGAYLSFKDLSYWVKIDGGLLSNIPIIKSLPFAKKHEYWLQLLRGITGYVKPGMALALMGASGAGKSTLLDVLAKRKTGGRIEGEILLNGKKPNRFLNRTVGYVEQQDIHLPFQTVREALLFSARLRLPSSVPKAKQEAFVDELMEILGLTPIANRIIIATNLEERKRVTMGVEMAANPSLLFLDEPTSGLDSVGADKVMNAISKVAKQGRSIICTIHQPSQQIFAKFTHLLLLRKGGEVVYFGPLHSHSHDGLALRDSNEDGEDEPQEPAPEPDFKAVLSYFADLGYHCPPRKNPADFVLDVSSSVPSKKEQKLHQKQEVRKAYLASELYQQVQQEVEEGIIPDKVEVYHYSSHYATRLGVQMLRVLQRNMMMVWRLLAVAKLNVIRSIFIGLVMGLLYFDQKSNIEGTNNILALLYYLLLLTNLVVFPVIPIIMMQKAVYFREKTSLTYRPFAYLFGLIMSSIPFNGINILIMLLPVYWMAGLRDSAGDFFLCLFILFLSLLNNYTFLALVAILSPNQIFAFTCTGLLLPLFSLFSGFLIARPSIPDYWIWAHYIDLNTYPFESLSIVQFQDKDLYCDDDELVPVPVFDPATNTTSIKPYCAYTSGNEVLDMFEFEEENLWRNIGIVAGMWVFFIICNALALRYVKAVKR